MENAIDRPLVRSWKHTTRPYGAHYVVYDSPLADIRSWTFCTYLTALKRS
jgi:hypothetical protein